MQQQALHHLSHLKILRGHYQINMHAEDQYQDNPNRLKYCAALQPVHLLFALLNFYFHVKCRVCPMQLSQHYIHFLNQDLPLPQLSTVPKARRENNKMHQLRYCHHPHRQVPELVIRCRFSLKVANEFLH